MSDVRKMIQVGKHRGFDGSIESYDLREYGDPECNVKNYSVEYIESAMRKHEMLVAGLKPNPDGPGLINVDAIKKSSTVIIDDEEPENQDQDKSFKKRKTYRHKKKSYSKKKHR